MKMIAAADEKWGIGKNGGLLCHLPGDMKFFRETTAGSTVVMGRVTFESLPGKKGLPKRRNIVITRREDYKAEGAEVVHSGEELKAAVAGTDPDSIFVIGGAEIYAGLLPMCDTVYITKIYRDFDADRFLPDLDATGEFEAEPLSEIKEENGIRYQFFKYTRVKDAE
ncbi:MAG: dihydrofolate reductase [Eubacterium sp.]